MDRYEIFRANQLETKNFLESIRKGKIPRRVVIKNIITGSGIISISSFSKREICKSSFDVTNETLRTRYLSKLFCSVHVLRPCHKFPRNFCMENLSLAIIRVSVINVQLHEEIFKRTSAKQNPSSNEGDLLECPRNVFPHARSVPVKFLSKETTISSLVERIDRG